MRRDRLTADGRRAADGPGASERTRVRRQLQGAYQEPTHAQAHAALDRLAKELEAVNVSAVG